MGWIWVMQKNAIEDEEIRDLKLEWRHVKFTIVVKICIIALEELGREYAKTLVI